jgi:hypothetical protein
MVTKQRLIGVSKTTHTTHDTENVVVSGIDTNLGSLGALNGSVGENKLKGSIVNAGEVARSTWLVLLGSQSKGVDIDTGVRSASVVLVRLDKVEVSTLTLREAILAVKLELSSDNRVLTPAVEGKRGLSEDESASIGDTRVLIGSIRVVDISNTCAAHIGLSVVRSTGLITLTPPISIGNIQSASLVEETRGVDERARVVSNCIVATECVNSIGKSIDSIGVVEGLSTKNTVEKLVALQRRAVVNVLVRLYNPNELLDGVIEVELNLIGRRANGLITSELKLLNKVLVGILSHTSALIGVQEDIVDIERGSNQRLVVGVVDTTTNGGVSGVIGAVKRTDSPQALIDGTDIKVDFDLVILKGDEGESKTGVTAVPELEGNIKGSLGESIAGGANLTRSVSLARTIDSIERGVGDEGKLGGVANHGVVTILLVNGKSKIVPDVHPVTILAVNALTTDLNLNLRNQLLTGEIKPTGINTVLVSAHHRLVNLRKSNLKIGAISQITIARNGAGHAATKICLTVKSLLDRLHSKVSVTFVRHLPKGNLRVARKINILGTVSYKLHKTSCHF